MIDAIISFVKDNISWIKDVITIVFTCVATVIGILTYRRARATILQPIRNEVIKKQSILLTELLDTVTSNIDHCFDYPEIAANNALLVLRDYGFVFKNNKDIIEQSEKQVAGWLPCGNSKILRDIRIVGVFNESEAKKKDVKDGLTIGKEKYEDAKTGIIEIDKIYFTHKYSEFYNKLSLYANSPFLPIDIRNVLSSVLKDVNTNLTKNLKSVLESVMREFCSSYFEKKEIKKISPIGVYNEFNHNRIHHSLAFENLREQIRKYLRIDEEW